MHDLFLNMHRRQHLVDLGEHENTSAAEIDFYHASTTFDGIVHMRSKGWYADLNVGNIFRVDTATDNIEEHQVADIWPQVEEADYKEVGQFVNENAFRAVRRDDLGADCAIIDGIWVRKWKKAPTGRTDRQGQAMEARTQQSIINSHTAVTAAHPGFRNKWNWEVPGELGYRRRFSEGTHLPGTVEGTQGVGRPMCGAHDSHRATAKRVEAPEKSSAQSSTSRKRTSTSSSSCALSLCMAFRKLPWRGSSTSASI